MPGLPSQPMEEEIKNSEQWASRMVLLLNYKQNDNRPHFLEEPGTHSLYHGSKKSRLQRGNSIVGKLTNGCPLQDSTEGKRCCQRTRLRVAVRC